MTLRALPPDERPAIASRFVRFLARGLRKMCRSPPLLESLRRSHPSGPESLRSHPDRKSRSTTSPCALRRLTARDGVGRGGFLDADLTWLSSDISFKPI